MIQRNYDKLFKYGCKNGDIDLVQTIYNFNSNIIYQILINDIGSDIMWFLTVFKKGYLEIAKILFIFELSLNIKIRAFITSADNKHLHLIKFLFDQIPNIDITPLNVTFRTACVNDDFDMAQWLFETRPDIDIKTNNHTAFIMSCTNKQINIARLLNSLNPLEYEITIVDDKLISWKIVKILKIKSTNSIKIKPDEIMDCLICHATLSNVITICSHMYCKTCISDWYKINETCPTCRKRNKKNYQ
jgi:hypothetical protein